ncbi:MAG: hypothetical protein ACE5QV_07935 [Fidelibacterota bacterium]
MICRLKIVCRCFLLIVLPVIYSCTGRLDEAVKLKIIFSGNVRGRIQPADYTENYQAGIARRSTLLSGMKERGNTIILDSGDLLFNNWYIDPAYKDELEMKAKILIESYNYMGYHALNIGDNEFADGMDFLRVLEKRANFPLLSTNIFHSGSDSPLFKEYIILEYGNLSVGIFGLTSDTDLFPRSIEIRDPVLRAERTVSKLKGKVDIVIALAHAKFKELEQIAARVKGINFIINSHSLIPLRNAARIADSYLFLSGGEGSHLNIIYLSFKKRGESFVDISLKKAQIAYLENELKRISGGRYPAIPEEAYVTDKQMLVRIRSLKLEKLKLEDEIEKLDNFFYYEIRPVGRNIAPDEEIEAIIENLKRDGLN